MGLHKKRGSKQELDRAGKHSVWVRTPVRLLRDNDYNHLFPLSHSSASSSTFVMDKVLCHLYDQSPQKMTQIQSEAFFILFLVLFLKNMMQANF